MRAPYWQKRGPIKIGIYADLSGGSAQWGNDTVKGSKLYIKEINAAGGIMGRKIEPIIYDCKMSPTEGVKAYTRLVNEDRVLRGLWLPGLQYRPCRFSRCRKDEDTGGCPVHG